MQFSTRALRSRVAVSMLHCGAFNPLHHKPLSIYCGTTDRPASLYGTTPEHSLEAGKLHKCPQSLLVPLAESCPRPSQESSWHLPRPVSGMEGWGKARPCWLGGTQHPREACVMVPVPWWITASAVSQLRGTLSTVSQEQAAAMQPQNVSPVRGLLQSPATAPTCCSEPVGGEFRAER